jgi:perosamine synthetase
MIPVSEPKLGDREMEYVAECVRTGWVSSSGRFIIEFEERWAAYCGRRYGVAVSNGTVALQLAVAALDLPAGAEVIMPTFTIISCAQAATAAGAVPVLVDAEARTWCMDTRQIEAKVTARTRAIMPVHIYGHPVDMDPVLDIARRHGLAVIEDAAEAHGAEYRSKRCGSFGTMSCFSFYANKLITTGEGGMVLTDDSELAAKLRSLRNLCFEPSRRFYHNQLGFNFRLTNLQAALGVAQIDRMEEIIEKKRWMAGQYIRRLKDIRTIQLPVEEPWARSVYWMFGIVLSEQSGMNTADFAVRLKDRKIETRPFFLGMHEQPVFLNKGLFKGDRYPVAERIARQGLYVPSGLGLTEEQIDTVCVAIRDVLR